MRVEIRYSPQLWEIGTVRELPDGEARLLIREGRAVEVYDDETPPASGYDQRGALPTGLATVRNTTGKPIPVVEPAKATPTE